MRFFPCRISHRNHLHPLHGRLKSEKMRFKGAVRTTSKAKNNNFLKFFEWNSPEASAEGTYGV